MPNTFRHPERQEVYSRITNRIVANLERGVRLWTKPCNAGHAPAGSRGHCARTAALPAKVAAALDWFHSCSKLLKKGTAP